MIVSKLARLLQGTLTTDGNRSSNTRKGRGRTQYYRSSLRTEQLESRQMMASDVIIAEFMADNANSIKDADGQVEDWIEIYNNGNVAENLQNWRLTDDVTKLSKWIFPAVVIQPGQSLMVFADSDATPPAGELHTNFGLSKSGEYLGLIKPDGTVATQFTPKFPAQYTDISYGFATTSVGGQIQVHKDQPRYFFTPTPGVPNVAGTNDVRPIITDVTHTTDYSDNAVVTVKARVVPSGAPVASTALVYRVMFGAEVGVPMFDDGTHGDGPANDGIYAASIPASAASPGQMVRYYIGASASTGAGARYPIFNNPTTTAQYQGYVINDPSVTSNLPIFQMFIQNPTWFTDARGNINQSVIAGSFYYNGHLYDNVHWNVRGDSSVRFDYPNPKFKVEFNDEDKFDFGDGRPKAGSINLDNMYQDPSYSRLTLAAELLRDAGAYAQLAQPVQTRMNGQFFNLAVYSERVRGPFLERNGLDKDGALYEAEGLRDSAGSLSPYAANLGTIAGMTKQNREEEASFADLQDLINGISPSNPNRDRYIFDNVNIPEVVDVIAGYALLKQYDRDTHNYYVYRDSDGDGEWSLIPYDLDLVWDRLIEPVYNTYFSGSPFEGSSQDPTWINQHWNVLLDAFADSPVLSQMVLRRTRTLMDELLQPTSTPMAQRKLEAKIDALVAKLTPDAQQDYARWGQVYGSNWGGPYTMAQGVALLKYGLDLRRNYLYSLPYIPFAQAANSTITIGAIDIAPESGNDKQQFVQLVNNSGVAVDVSGWQITATGTGADAFKPFTLAKGVIIPANGSVYVTADVKAFRARTVGPHGGQGLFIQDGYEGLLSAGGGTITLKRPDGSTSNALTYAAVNRAPRISQLGDLTLTSGITSTAISLPVSDPDNATSSLTFSGVSNAQTYVLDQQFALSAPSGSSNYYLNTRGSNEKYLYSTPSARWFYILPNGEFYLFTGSTASTSPAALQGSLIARLSPAVYQNPALLHNATPVTDALAFSFTTGASPTMTVTPRANVTGDFVATVYASDGQKSGATTFLVHVNEPTTAAPQLAPIATQTLTTGVASAQIPLNVSDADTPVSSLTFTGSATSQLYQIDQQRGLNYPGRADYYFNTRGSSEKYVNTAGGQWYFIMPNGNLFLFTGSNGATTPASLVGTLIADVGVDAYQNPALLHDAQNVPNALSFQFTTGASPSMKIVPAPNVVGKFTGTVTVSDGTKTDSESFLIVVSAPTTAAPALGPIANQALTTGVASAAIALQVSDSDTPITSLVFSGSAQSQLFQLDQQLGLNYPGRADYYFNTRGSSEKYVNTAVGTWYYILPNGNLFRFTGSNSSTAPSSLVGTLIANVGTAAYQNPALLHDAQNVSNALTFQFTNGGAPSVKITPGANVAGSFTATITVSDGSKSDSESFLVTVSEPTTAAPLIGPIDSQTLAAGATTGQIPVNVSDPDTATSSLTFVGTSESALYRLDQRLNLTVAPGSSTYYLNTRGSNEKYLYNPSGTDSINRWYYILPNGNLFLFTGNPSSTAPSSLQGTLVANVGAAAYQNPIVLANAVSITNALSFQFTTGAGPTMQITAGNVTGPFEATVRVSDGTKSNTTTFNVQVTSAAASGEAAPDLRWSPMDVSGDGQVSPLDAVLLINHLNAAGVSASGEDSSWLDTSDDGMVSPLDVLLVINFLNSGTTATAAIDSAWHQLMDLTSPVDEQTLNDLLA
jgi:hypothetical protein